MYIVYGHINKLNKKMYVGLTSQSTFARWKNGEGYKRHKRFYNDILKYGWDNFDHIIFLKTESQEEAQKKEEELIAVYDLTNEDKGYNKFTCSMLPYLDETARAKIKGNTNFKGHKHTEESKRLMRKNRPKKRVVCVETQTKYESTREAERQTGVYHGDISKCCKGTKKKAGGFRWVYG